MPFGRARGKREVPERGPVLWQIPAAVGTKLAGKNFFLFSKAFPLSFQHGKSQEFSNIFPASLSEKGTAAGNRPGGFALAFPGENGPCQSEKNKGKVGNVKEKTLSSILFSWDKRYSKSVKNGWKVFLFLLFFLGSRKASEEVFQVKNSQKR